MAAAIETPVQFERDLRSANRGWKRDKDSSEKWAAGQRPLHGVKLSPFTGDIQNNVPEEMLFKSRPMKKWSDYPKNDHKKRKSNPVKASRPHPDIWKARGGRVRGKFGAKGEIDEPATSRSLIDLLVPAARKEDGGSGVSWGLSSIDGVLYSFDAADTPSRPVTLETFVKANNTTTERLVEKEYEILDVNGDLLKGRKARRDLRKSVGVVGDCALLDDDDDEEFELV